MKTITWTCSLILIAAISIVAFAGALNRVPLNVDVITASRLIVPSTTKHTNQWAISTAYVYGDKVINSNKSYWCISAGTSSATVADGPSALDGDDTTDASVTWRYARERRSQLYIINDGANIIYLGFGNAAVTNRGIRLNANGGVYFVSGDLVPLGDVFAITVAGVTNNAVIQEN